MAYAKLEHFNQLIFVPSFLANPVENWIFRSVLGQAHLRIRRWIITRIGI